MSAKPRGQYARSAKRVRTTKSLNGISSSTTGSKPLSDSINAADRMDVSDQTHIAIAQQNSASSLSSAHSLPQVPIVASIPPPSELSQADRINSDGTPTTAALVTNMLHELESALSTVQQGFLLQLQAKDTEVTSLRTALQSKYQDDMRTHDRQLVELMQKNSSLERELTIIREQTNNIELNNKNKYQMEYEEKLNSELKKKEINLRSTYDEHLNNIQKVNQKLIEQNTQYSADLQRSNNQKNEFEQRLLSFKRRFDDLNKVCESQKKDLNSLQLEKQKLEIETKRSQQEILELNNKTKTFTTIIDDLHSANQKLTTDHTTLDVSYQRLQRLISEQQRELDILHIETTNLRKKETDLSNNNLDLEREVRRRTELLNERIRRDMIQQDELEEKKRQDEVAEHCLQREAKRHFKSGATTSRAITPTHSSSSYQFAIPDVKRELSSELAISATSNDSSVSTVTDAATATTAAATGSVQLVPSGLI